MYCILIIDGAGNVRSWERIEGYEQAACVAAINLQANGWSLYKIVRLP